MNYAARGFRLALAACVAVGALALSGQVAHAGTGVLGQKTGTHALSAPSAPLNVRASVGQGAVTVTWDAPADDGGAPIRAYQVSPVGIARVHVVKPSSSTVLSDVFTELQSGVPVRFVVKAVNRAGTSPLSEASEAVTPGPVVRASIYRPGAALNEGLYEGSPRNRSLLTVWLTDVATEPVTVRLRTTAAGSAVPGEDFEPIDTVITFPVGVRTTTVPLTLVDDTVVEAAETIGLDVTSDQVPTGELVPVVVYDDDAETMLYVDGPTTIAEGDTGDTDLGLTLRLSRPARTTMRVMPWVTATAVDGRQDLPVLQHLAAPPTAVTIPAGATTASLGLAVRGDRTPEPDVQLHYTLQVLADSAATSVRAAASGSIVAGGETVPPSSTVLVTDDDTTKAAHDLTLGATPTGSAPKGRFLTSLTVGDTWTLKVANKGGRAVDDAEIVLSAGPDAPLALPDTCTSVADPGTGVVRGWRCPLGSLARGARVSVPVRVTASRGDSQVAVEAYVAWPGMDDATPTNNGLRGTLRIAPSTSDAAAGE